MASQTNHLVSEFRVKSLQTILMSVASNISKICKKKKKVKIISFAARLSRTVFLDYPTFNSR